jgi:hypothetical protein
VLPPAGDSSGLLRRAARRSSADVPDAVFAEIRSVPRDRAVVGVIVQDGQAVMSRRSCDHEVHCRSAAVLAGMRAIGLPHLARRI